LCARQAARIPAGWKTLQLHAAQSGEGSRRVRCAGRLRQTIHEQNPSKPDAEGTSNPDAMW